MPCTPLAGWCRVIVTTALGSIAALSAAGAFRPVPAVAQAAAPAKVEVVALRHLAEKGIVGLEFAVDNQSGEQTSLAELGLSDSGRRVSDLKLIDFQAGKDYWIGSTGGSCLCSTFEDGAPLGPGERQEFWAWFGAPPPGVSKLALFVPGVPPLFDVPLAS